MAAQMESEILRGLMKKHFTKIVITREPFDPRTISWYRWTRLELFCRLEQSFFFDRKLPTGGQMVQLATFS